MRARLKPRVQEEFLSAFGPMCPIRRMNDGTHLAALVQPQYVVATVSQ